MTNRYEILDILSQDASGVCFHATDRETGRDVALRRFFPFGPEGGGLEDEERAAYEIGVKRLQNVSHPALRAVLNGGTDPVDGMPFLVTEWIEGEMLSDQLHDGPINPDSVRALADLALETSQVLSDAFGEEAIWVETDPSVVILSNADPARKVTFWISPLRWLGDPSARSDLKPLLEMVETLSGWNGQMISRSSGGGLGAWVKTLRDNPSIWSLGEAKAALHEPATIVEAAADQAAANPAPPQQVVFVNRPVIWPWVLAGTLALSAAGILGWRHFNPPSQGNLAAAVEATPNQPEPAAPAAPSPPSPSLANDTTPPPEPAEPAEPVVADTEIEVAPVEPPTPTSQTAPPESETAVERMNRIAAEMADRAENSILVTPGEKGSFEGTIVQVVAKPEGKQCYLQFEVGATKQTVWAFFKKSDWEDFDYNVDDIKGTDGKKARASGRWEVLSYKHDIDAAIRMTRPEQLELLD
ncbi:hypothetical protein [Haloferula sp.]|uniref:hypothetical protein n=1 Tax=Haloferula sp. TaxID=2497595 RepID=UPI00329D91B3